MSATVQQSHPTRRRVEVDDRIRKMITDLDQSYDRNANDTKGSNIKSRFSLSGALEKVEDKKRYNRDLDIARRAAAKLFTTDPSMSNRKQAMMMLTAGALGVSAFTGPQVFRPSYAQTTEAVFVDANGKRQQAILLKASDAFKQALVEEEGVRYTVYRDVAGYPTVGVGHLVLPEDNLRVGDTISEEVAMAFLERDLAKAEQGVRNLVKDLPLYQHEFDALLDLVYNVGEGNVSEHESPRLNAAVQNADYDGIAAELNYTHAAGQVARGLEFRSERRAQIFSEGNYDNPREIASRGNDTVRS